jgi:integrase
MCKHPRLQRRGAIYWFRCRIPADLVQHYGRREILKSLRTRDPREAVRLARSLSEDQEQEFDRIRAAQTITELSDAQVQALADEQLQSALQLDEWMRVSGLSEEMYDRIEAGIEELDGWLPEAIATGDIENVRHLVEWAIKKHGLAISIGSAEYKRLGYAMLKAVHEANEAIRERHGGGVVATPKGQPVHIASVSRKGHAAGVDELLEYWARKGDAKAHKTLHEARTTAERFKELHGDLPVATVERRHVIELRDALVKKGLAPATVKKQLGLLRSMLQVALEDEQFGLKANPCTAVKVRGEVGAAKQRAAFTPEELRQIFAAPIFAMGARPKGGAGEAAYWLPLLALYTGARLNEIGQLRLDDLQESERIKFIRFTDAGEHQSLKTGRSARRRVPVHAELLRRGLWEYAARLRKAGGQRLFPLLKVDSHGHLTGPWSKWWNRYQDRVIGIADPSRDFHSFRHTFKHYSRACGIPEDVHDALTGHANAVVARTYGGAEGYPLKPLAEAIERLRYDL